MLLPPPSLLFASFCAYASICKLFIVYHHPNIHTLDVFAVMGVCITEISFLCPPLTRFCVCIKANCNFLLLSSLPRFVYLDTALILFFVNKNGASNHVFNCKHLLLTHRMVLLENKKYQWDFGMDERKYFYIVVYIFERDSLKNVDVILCEAFRR